MEGERELAAALVRFWDDLREAVSLEDVIEMVRRGDIGRLDGLIPWERADRFFVRKAAVNQPVSGILAEVVVDGARGSGFGARLDLINPHAVSYAEERATQLAGRTTREAREVVRTTVTDALRFGGPPAQTARTIREVIGLAPRQAAAVGNYARALVEAAEEGLPGSTLASRFSLSPISGRSRVTGARVDDLITKYAERQRAYRARMIARTETFRAANAGNMLSWQDAARQGLIDKNAAQRIWVTNLDERTCPTCGPMDGQVIAFSAEFEGTAGKNVVRAQYPPIHPSCRCTMSLDVAGRRSTPQFDPAIDRPDFGDEIPFDPDKLLPPSARVRGNRLIVHEGNDRIPTGEYSINSKGRIKTPDGYVRVLDPKNLEGPQAGVPTPPTPAPRPAPRPAPTPAPAPTPNPPAPVSAGPPKFTQRGPRPGWTVELDGEDVGSVMQDWALGRNQKAWVAKLPDGTRIGSASTRAKAGELLAQVRRGERVLDTDTGMWVMRTKPLTPGARALPQLEPHAYSVPTIIEGMPKSGWKSLSFLSEEEVHEHAVRARARLKRLLPDLSIRDLEKLPPGMRDQLLLAIDDVVSAFGVRSTSNITRDGELWMSKLRAVKVKRLPDGTTAQASRYSDGAIEITLNIDHFANPDIYEMMWEANRESGWWAYSNDFRGSLVHELGHAFEYSFWDSSSYSARHLERRFWQSVSESVARDPELQSSFRLVGDISDHRKSRVELDDDAMPVSTYALTNRREFLAESFMDVFLNGDGASETSLRFMRHVHTVLEKEFGYTFVRIP